MKGSVTMKKTTSVFWITFAIIILFAILGVMIPERFETTSGIIMDYISVHFGWYYLAIVASFLIFCIYLIFSRYGKMVLGRRNDKPEFSYPSWFAMLFSAGMGIGLVFFGVAEPISQYMKTPPTAEPGTREALEDAIRVSFFHYGVHAWAVYATLGLILSYFTFRLKKPGLISVTLEPILGDRVNGAWGKAIDVIAVFATIVGVATTLGFGAAQINGGLAFLCDVQHTFWIQLIIIIIVTVLFMLSAYTGLDKGIKILSNANMGLATILLLVTFTLGPTMFILDTFIETIGTYIQTLPTESLRIAPNSNQEQAWIMDWTVFFWAWWIA